MNREPKSMIGETNLSSSTVGSSVIELSILKIVTKSKSSWNFSKPIVCLYFLFFQISHSLKGNEYFLQIGDDVVLQHRGWDTSSILKLKENFGIGVCGLVDAGRRRYNPTDSLITQGVVTKIHYNIFNINVKK